MSVSTSTSRIRELANVLRGINDGTVPEEKARKVLANIDPVELSLAEQQLIHDGVAPEQLRRLCVAHMKVLERETEDLKAAAGEGHPLHTLISEHELILGFLDSLEEAVTRIEKKGALVPGDEDVATVANLAEHLVETDKHHKREEDALFPALEERGITGPTRVMRIEHDDMRPRKKHLLELARGAAALAHDDTATTATAVTAATAANTVGAPTDGIPDIGLRGRAYDEFVKDLRETASFIIFNLRDHIFKENTILYPTAFRAIRDPKVWDDLLRKCDEIGYCCFTPRTAHDRHEGGKEVSSMSAARKIRVEDLPVTVSPRGPRIRKVLSTDDVVVTNVILGPGQELPVHSTPVDVFFYVRSGSGLVIVGDEEIEGSDGDIVLSPKGIPHGLRAAQSEEFSVLVVKTPNPDAQR